MTVADWLISASEVGDEGVSLKPGWGVGIIVAILLSVAVGLFGIVNLAGMVSLLLLLCGLWTLVAAFTIVELKDRSYYMGWGIVVAALSLFDFIPFNYTIALILMAIVVLIIINVYLGRAPKMYEAATAPPPSGGGTPAATAI
jgi:hypothetical protein